MDSTIASCIHQLVEAQVEKTPDSIAVVYKDERITYGELNKRANRLAHYIGRLGVPPDSFVAICIERSIEMIVALFGILKAGGAYIPIDPEYPADRLAYMLENSEAPVLIAQSSLKEKLSGYHKKTIYIDTEWDAIASEKDGNPDVGVTPENLIYMIYTSGSTGRPKGSLVYHSGVTNLLRWYTSDFGYDSGNRTLLMTSFCFDLTQKNIYAPLITGGSLHLLESQHYDADIILKSILKDRITSINCTPSSFSGLLINSDYWAHLASLKYIFLGGEPVPIATLLPWINSGSCQATIVNVYGPTECSAVVAYHVLKDYQRYLQTSVPVGRPIFNTEILILDDHLKPVAPGRIGEICVVGQGVGGGYFKRPGLTEKVFVDNPHPSSCPGRLYRTGDHGRFLENGDIEYHGRKDHQVKIRGFRIELGEIENKLGQHEDVQKTVIMAREDTPGEPIIAAYIVLKPDRAASVNVLRSYLQLSLPDFMLPTAWVFMDKIPLNPNGKVDRKALPVPSYGRPKLDQAYVKPQTELEIYLAGIWCELLNIDQVGIKDRFFELGGSSIKAIQFIGRLGKELKTPIPIVKFFEKPTIAGFSETLRDEYAPFVEKKFGSESSPASTRPVGMRPVVDRAARRRELLALQKEKHKSRKPRTAKVSTQATAAETAGFDIAIIGMACRLPGADTLDKFWHNLKEGVASIITVDADDLKAAKVDPAVLNDSMYVNKSAYLEDADCFDASFFGFFRHEAELMSPQHRIYLETAWSALEHAGYDAERFEGAIGVFGGVARDKYCVDYISRNDEQYRPINEYLISFGNEKDYPSTRVAYKLNLKGPAFNVQNACSSSGVATHLACGSLLRGDCDMALVGGCRVLLPLKSGYWRFDGSPLSAGGLVRAFDARADGFIRGSGGGFIVLKRLKDAVDDNDTIYAVIRGSAVNNDGADKMGFAAPGVAGQSAVIAEALRRSGVTADTVSYVEAHGTGTLIGDPIEVEAITKAFRETTGKKNYCGIGSVKTNVGHLDAGSCVTGIIKTVLALKHEMLPPSLNFETPNPQIDFENSPFYVNSKLTPWPTGGAVRRAGVSSFGLGGTNVHVVLEEPPPPNKLPDTRPVNLLCISAKTETALDTSAENLVAYIGRHSELALNDIAYTLQQGRKLFDYRRFSVFEDRSDIAEMTSAVTKARNQRKIIRDVETVFMFPGQGSQYINMGQQLAAHIPVFKRALDACADILKPMLNDDIRDILFTNEADREPAAGKLRQTRYTQPIMFSIGYALAQTLNHWGIFQDMMIGHSVGEILAATLADVFSLEDGLHVAAQRGELIQNLPPGAMIAVRLAEAKVRQGLPDALSIAACNAPELCVVSGPQADIDAYKSHLKSNNVAAGYLQTSHAFHSAMMAPAVEPFAAQISKLKLAPPKIPLVSTVTGDWLTAEQALDPRYWADHIRSTVHFSKGVRTLMADREALWIEVGPQNALATFIRQHRKSQAGYRVFPLLGESAIPENELRAVMSTVGGLWMTGVNIDWTAFYEDEKRQRVALPAYPFERKRFWVDPTERPESNQITAEAPSKQPVGADVIPFQELKEEQTGKTAAPVNAPRVAEHSEEPIMVTNIPGREQQLIQNIIELIEEVTGEEIDVESAQATFMELGFDSLFLTQISQALKNQYQIDITFRQLIEDLPNLAILGAYILERLSPEIADTLFKEEAPALPTDAPQPDDRAECLQNKATPPAPDVTVPLPTDGAVAQERMPEMPASLGPFEHLFAQQLNIIAKQLEVLGASRETVRQSVPGTAQSLQAITAPSTQRPPAASSLKQTASKQTGSKQIGAAPDDTPENLKKDFAGPKLTIARSGNDDLTPRQREHLERLTKRYTEKTRGSKQFTQSHRSILADPRAVSGFRPHLKELVYPIVVERSSGSRLWDIDGNEYVDMLNGFGSNFFGHAHPVIMAAVKDQLTKGIEIGPQHPLAGEVARLIIEFTKLERVAFCNTGSEAVVGALRIARTVTGRKTVVVFAGAYHGIFDEVIVRGTKNFRSLSASPGILSSAVENMLVLDYGSEESLDIIRERSAELAAVLVEPVQSRLPELQPREFLHRLREITRQSETVLIFDEVVTGFRTCPGGAQEHFGVQADVATYGKVVGAGMPIGVIAGKRKYMDALDGGHWQYGDASFPEIGVTYFAGTFVRHPPALAAAKAGLTYLKEKGPALQQDLNRRTEAFVADLNQHFKNSGLPIQLTYFSSLMRIGFTREVANGELLFVHMREKGVHIWPRPCFLTISHSDEDIVQVKRVIKESAAEMQQGGFFDDGSASEPLPLIQPAAKTQAPPVPDAKLGRDPDGNPGWFVTDPDRPGKYLQVGSIER